MTRMISKDIQIMAEAGTRPTHPEARRDVMTPLQDELRSRGCPKDGRFRARPPSGLKRRRIDALNDQLKNCDRRLGRIVHIERSDPLKDDDVI